MDIYSFSKLVILIRMFLLYFLSKEFYHTQFKNKSDKVIWMIIIIGFGYLGYSMYLAFRRKLIVRRKFAPMFNDRS